MDNQAGDDGKLTVATSPDALRTPCKTAQRLRRALAAMPARPELSLGSKVTASRARRRLPPRMLKRCSAADAAHLLVVALEGGKGGLEKLGQRHPIAGHERQIRGTRKPSRRMARRMPTRI